MAESIARDGATGRAIVSSTGTPVDDILQAIRSGGTVQHALALDPRLTLEAVDAALRFAAVAVGREARYTPDPGFGVSQVREVAVQRPRAWRAPSPAGGGMAGALATADRRRERLAYELDVVDGVRDGLHDVAAGRLVPHDDVVARMRARFPA